MSDDLDITCLERGNPRQRRCYKILRNLRVMEFLSEFFPILTGTIPLSIDIPGSDLDIVCEVRDTGKFHEVLTRHFGDCDRFSLRVYPDGIIVCNFFAGGQELEIFGSPVPSLRNNAYRHMVVERRLLNMGGSDFRQRIVGLKQQGMKTEPAFAHLLGLYGDLYEALLALEEFTDEQLKSLF